MPTETIDSNELSALRQQAAEAIPYKNEAIRLARKLWEEDQRHPAIAGELWAEHVKQWDYDLLVEAGYSPEDISESIGGKARG